MTSEAPDDFMAEERAVIAGLDYDDAGTSLVRRVLLGVGRGEFRRFRNWSPEPTST